MHVLGIDAGGTRTVCLLADQAGTVCAEARAGGANLQSAGELEVEKTLHRVMEQAVGDHELPAAICLGMAGVDRDEDATVVRGIMQRIGYKARVLVVNDALIALVSAVRDAAGLVVVAGTGSIAYGRDSRNRAARAGGWGYVLGDEGSGYWIGRLALRAVVRHADGRGRPSRLTDLVLQHFGVRQPQDLIHEVYHGMLRPSEIAALAILVQRAVDAGDEVASKILDSGADELTRSAQSVASRLGIEHDEFRFVLAGGIMRAVPSLAGQVSERFTKVAPRCRPEILQVEPALGAVYLALAEARGGANIPAYL